MPQWLFDTEKNCQSWQNLVPDEMDYPQYQQIVCASLYDVVLSQQREP